MKNNRLSIGQMAELNHISVSTLKVGTATRIMRMTVLSGSIP